MSGEQVAEVCRTSPGQTQVNTLVLCWCTDRLAELITSGKLEKTLKVGSTGDDVENLHEHLIRFGFKLELMQAAKNGDLTRSPDLKNKVFGTFTERALRMFALHPQAGEADPENIIRLKPEAHKKLTTATAAKLQAWCRDCTASPENYWEFKGLKLAGKEQSIDAFGNDQGRGKQSAWHHHIWQVQQDLSQIGFGVHDDELCTLNKQGQPTGEYKKADPKARDKELQDLDYLITKFRRQAKWLWRMHQNGTHLPDVTPGDPTYYAGELTGPMDAATAKVLRAWVERSLHMVIAKFPVQDLHWPPATFPGSRPIKNVDGNKTACLRQDAYDAWLAATTSIYEKGGAFGLEFSSAPRSWTSGKPASGQANSPFSYHYTALAIDIDQSLVNDDGIIKETAKVNWRYIREEDGNRFRLWCWVKPQPSPPPDAAEDLKNSYVQYRNRKPPAAIPKPGKKAKRAAPAPAPPNTLFHMNNHFKKVPARPGWYLDLTKVMEENGLMRIGRHDNWRTNAKAWEWWHYQFIPARPPGSEFDPGFGEYMQLFGVHEHKLRAKGWSSHEDIEKKIG